MGEADDDRRQDLNVVHCIHNIAWVTYTHEGKADQLISMQVHSKSGMAER